VYKLIFPFCAGVLTLAGFAPFGFFPLTIIGLAILLVQWLAANTARQAATIGGLFGLGLFGAGSEWLYIALHDYGDMAVPTALIVTALFILFMALFPALAGFAQAKFKASERLRLGLIMPVVWVLVEWFRGWIFTGLPWLGLGYSQVPVSPLAGYAPLLGVYGVSLAVALSAGLLAVCWKSALSRHGILSSVILVLVWLCGFALGWVEWTQPQGEPLKVGLAQGNISQALKFNQDNLIESLEIYRKLVLQSDARLIVLPETALPMLREEVPVNYAEILSSQMKKNGGDIIIGIFERESGQFYNSVFTLGSATSQTYRKNHLVPFGEFIPLRGVFGWVVNGLLNIPMSDLARGGAQQPVLKVAGQNVAVNICYEDVFGEEIIRALPEATLLVNVSNDAWYGDSNLALQHNQISQMRALESGRMMLRATNTGVTSIIDRKGQILKMLPQREQAILSGQVQGYSGSTPYVRFGNSWLLVLLGILMFLGWRLRVR
jgi:apolipoprotein N-acyltransferase